MAEYKVIDAEKLDAELKNLANKIREKGGTTEELDFYEGDFTKAVGAIESDSGLPDWDDNSTIIASGKAYASKNIHWEITEKGTFRWVIDYPSTLSFDNQGYLCNGTQVSILMGIRPEILPFLSKIRQYYAPDGLTAIEHIFMVNCERVRVPTTLTNIPTQMAMYALRELDMSADIYIAIYDYYCSGMYGLEKVTLSPLITTIPANCFQNCYSLMRLILKISQSISRQHLTNVLC